MGRVNVLSVGATYTSALRFTQKPCITGLLASHVSKGASFFVGLRRRRVAKYLLQKNRLKRRRLPQNVRVRAQSLQSSLLLAGDTIDQGAAKGQLALVEVGPEEEQELADWIGTQPLHEKFDEVVAARDKERDLDSEDGSEDKKQATAPDERAQKAGSFSSLQREKKLENRKGLMGFKKVETNVSGSEASSRMKEQAGTRMQDHSGIAKESSSGDQGGPEETAKTTKGGTRIIRRKGKGETRRFEAFLGQLPSSVPIPLSETSASAETLGTERQEQTTKVAVEKLPQKAVVSPTEEQTLKKPSKSPAISRVKRARSGQPSTAAPQSREDVAERVSDFTTRLFRAVTASNSHQDFWDLMRDPNPQIPTAKPASTSSKSVEEVSGGFIKTQPTKVEEKDIKAPSIEKPVETQRPNAEVDTQAGASEQEAVLAPPDSNKAGKSIVEEEREPASQDALGNSNVESLDATSATSQGPESIRTETERTSAEPSFPHWLVGSSSRDTLLVDAEGLPAQIWEGEGPLKSEEKSSSEKEEGQRRTFGTKSRSVDQGSQPLPNGVVSQLLDSGLRDEHRTAEAPADLRLSTGQEIFDALLSGTQAGSGLASQTSSGQRIGKANLKRRGIISLAQTFAKGRPIRGLLRFLTAWENREAKPEAAPQVKLDYPERPTFADIVEGDKRVLSSALTYTQWWLRSWQVPLQSDYDPEVVDDYFRKRPHLVLGRLFQIVTAFTMAAAPLVPELARAKMVRKPDAFGRQEELEKRAAVEKVAQRFKRELVALGPTFIKAAQSLSSRPDIVGEDAAAVLSELQDRLPPFSSAEAMRVIEQELGRPADEVFLELSETPIAAASFGQVYKGRTRDGEIVAVKVQRPRVLASVALDIHILRSLLQAVRTAARINSDLRLLADELGRGLYGELDYHAEAANAELFASSQAHLPFVAVPRVLHPYSARRVLTMEWVEGDRPVDLLAAAAAGNVSAAGATEASLARTKLLSLVNMGIESSLVQLLETGLMHSDPHPGNLLLRADGKLVYLDFGLITLITRQHQDAMLAAIAHLVNAEWAALTDDLDALDVLKPTNDRREVARALAEAFSGGPQPLISGAGVPRVRFGQVASKLWGVALRFRFKLPPYFTLVLRNLASLEGIGLSADPSFKVFASAYPHVIRKLLTENTPATRRVLRTLLTDGKGGIRWERLSLLASGSSEGSGMSASLRQEGAPPLAARAAKVVFGRKGAGVRRVLLALDLVRIARGFSSTTAAPLRALLAEAAADSLDQRLFGYRPNQNVLNSPQQAANPQSGGPSIQVASVDELSETSAARFNVYDPSSRRDDKAVAPALEERLLRKRAWLLVKLIASRLPRSPVQKVLVSWVGLVFALTVARAVGARAWRRLGVAAQGLAVELQKGPSSEDRLRPMPSFI